MLLAGVQKLLELRRDLCISGLLSCWGEALELSWAAVIDAPFFFWPFIWTATL